MAEKYTYPLYFTPKKKPNIIIKFTSLTTGEIIVEDPNAKKGALGFHEPKGTVVTNFIPHTETKTWERVKKPNIKKQFNYPLIFKNKSGLVVEFTGLKLGEVLEVDGNHPDEFYIGEIVDDFIEHTGTYWTEVKDYYTKETILKTTNQKENTMQHANIDIKVNGKQIKLEDTPKTPKTPLEAHSKYVTIWFNIHGDISHQTSESSKQANKALQKRPDFLGYTFVTYKKTASRTTDIPTKAV